jgi:carbon-monoxide dehydrogenase medium subunit
VKPPAFDYSRPGSVSEALELLAEHGSQAKVLAGGQSLIPLLSMRLASPGRLIDINSLAELDFVQLDDDGVRVGALARHATVLKHRPAGPALAVLGAALACVAHPTIRNRGTTVGSIVHADPAAEMPAVLRLLGGAITVRSSTATRTIPATELYAGPLETSLAADELAVEAFFPAPSGHTGTAFLEVSRRHGDYAVCGVAALVRLDEDLRVVTATAAYLSMAGTPQLLELTEAVHGLPYADDFAGAGRLARARLDPEPDIHASAAYRLQLADILTGRALADAAEAAAHRREPSGRPT